ncbi:hypothetical protein E2C01_016101 [Portunus trituberculatus]|uniref:Uncharacterized protein n=1 Tax=Portunus trituberculatus TaxID=210409 RepID=A0A5B7DQ22_PORTR|nr:hypothetical protein [Portunus trituberculatus]
MVHTSHGTLHPSPFTCNSSALCQTLSLRAEPPYTPHTPITTQRLQSFHLVLTYAIRSSAWISHTTALSVPSSSMAAGHGSPAGGTVCQSLLVEPAAGQDRTLSYWRLVHAQQQPNRFATHMTATHCCPVTAIFVVYQSGLSLQTSQPPQLSTILENPSHTHTSYDSYYNGKNIIATEQLM